MALLLRCSSLFSPGPSISPFPLYLSPFALFVHTVPLLHLLPAPTVGPAYPPPNLRLCERASPVAPPREQELASRRIIRQLACPGSRPCQFVYSTYKNIFARLLRLCLCWSAPSPCAHSILLTAEPQLHRDPRTLLIAPTTLPIGRFSITTLPYHPDLYDP
jgi:hypothetical protein